MGESVIRSFKNRATERIFNRMRSRKIPPDIQRAALRKLLILDAAGDLRDLRIPPGNRLEALGGNRDGQHSIRINVQWRLCFVWKSAGPEEVEIVDYH